MDIVNKLIYRYSYAYEQSQIGGKMDQKSDVLKDEQTLYIFNEIAYNRDEAGNIVWGAAMAYLDFDLDEAKAYAQAYTMFMYQKLDQEWEQKAIGRGWMYYNSDLREFYK